MNLGIRDECDPAKALLEEHLERNEMNSTLGSIVGLGFAYAGSCRDDLLDTLMPYISSE